MNDTDQVGQPVAGPLEAPVRHHYLAKVTTWTGETKDMLPVMWKRCAILCATSIDEALTLADLFACGAPSFGLRVTGREVHVVSRIELPYEIKADQIGQ